MSSTRLHALVFLIAAGCTASTAPQMKILGVERAHHGSGSIVLLQVVNHAQRPMQLERLQYSFGAAQNGGELSLDRTVEAGAAVIVQVPLDLGTTAIPPGQPLILDGELYAHENATERTFAVRASVTPPAE